MSIFDELKLPNGTVIPNRIAKAAMEENLADYEHRPSPDILNLYNAWAEGGAGLIITGNVMVDRRAATGPGGIILENDNHLSQFQEWAKVITKNGANAWMQINHPGRQMPKDLGQETVAPSAVALDLGSNSNRFGVPREMNQEEIQETISRFIHTAILAEKAGFDGVEIHAAHGYLISQFLSPLVNKRTDEWGGSIENRSRFLLEVVKGIRSKVSQSFAVAVKLNSADFQRGGFSQDDAKKVVQQLNGLGVDLVELSGGSYESPAMMGQERDNRTLAREAYFLEFAREIKDVAKMPLMVTGGIRRKSVAEEVVNSGIEMVGIATALSLQPNLPNEWKNNRDSAPQMKLVAWKNKGMSSMATMSMVKYQFRRIVRGKPVDTNVSPLKALLLGLITAKSKTKKYKSWMAE